MTAKLAGKRFSEDETSDWLVERLLELNILTYEEFAEQVGIDRGTLSRYFRQERRPSIDVVAPLCDVLEVSPETLLIVLGAIDRKS
jgi:transcriptional regulator with XRE-family HTH domain